MPQSFDSVILHIVFSTKNRYPFLHEEIRDEMHRYLAQVGREYVSEVYAVGGVADHVHIALSLGRLISISDVLRELKIGSSKWARKGLGEFAWQSGSGVFSVSKSHLSALVNYIRNQAERNCSKRSFSNG